MQLLVNQLFKLFPVNKSKKEICSPYCSHDRRNSMYLEELLKRKKAPK